MAVDYDEQWGTYHYALRQLVDAVNAIERHGGFPGHYPSGPNPEVAAAFWAPIVKALRANG